MHRKKSHLRRHVEHAHRREYRCPPRHLPVYHQSGGNSPLHNQQRETHHQYGHTHTDLHPICGPSPLRPDDGHARLLCIGQYGLRTALGRPDRRLERQDRIL